MLCSSSWCWYADLEKQRGREREGFARFCDARHSLHSQHQPNLSPSGATGLLLHRQLLPWRHRWHEGVALPQVRSRRRSLQKNWRRQSTACSCHRATRCILPSLLCKHNSRATDHHQEPRRGGKAQQPRL